MKTAAGTTNEGQAAREIMPNERTSHPSNRSLEDEKPIKKVFDDKSASIATWMSSFPCQSRPLGRKQGGLGKRELTSEMLQ